jgi:hypothetical protein
MNYNNQRKKQNNKRMQIIKKRDKMGAYTIKNDQDQ